MPFTDICLSASRANGIAEIPLGASPANAVAPGVNVTTAVQEIWKMHGLDTAHPLSVSAAARSVDTIAQTLAGTTTVVVTRTA